MCYLGCVSPLMVLFAYLIFATACFTFGSSRADLDHVHGSHFKKLQVLRKALEVIELGLTGTCRISSAEPKPKDVKESNPLSQRYFFRLVSAC